jgi:hypothetical protein
MRTGGPALRAHGHPPDRAQWPNGLQGSDLYPTRSRLIAAATSEDAVSCGRISAALVAPFVFDACDANRLWICSYPQAPGSAQTRMDDQVMARNPSDPFKDRTAIGTELRRARREG